MSIDLVSEKLITFIEATYLIPRRRAGRKCDVSTIYRWSQNGCRGVVLETLQVGGTRCTSIEKLQAFFDALSAPGRSAPKVRATASRRRAIARAEAELERAGI